MHVGKKVWSTAEDAAFLISAEARTPLQQRCTVLLLNQPQQREGNNMPEVRLQVAHLSSR